ncbi:MAG: MltA domain-containing protein [Candidatus Sedimenticola sp. (ex Thyasira tokunagai)]
MVLTLALLSGCSIFIPKEAGIGEEVSWDDLPGWQEDSVADAWPALLSQCTKLRKKKPGWETICSAADQLQEPTDKQVRTFIREYFQPHEIIGTGGSPDGLITGYYEPTLLGSLEADERFAYPIYARPDSLLIIDLAKQFPSLKGKRVRGRLVGNRVIPYYDRTDIDGSKQPLKGKELLWVDDPHGSFFLQIQGSGRVQLPDGSSINVGYADQNGHQYVSIGKKLIERGELSREEVSLFTIREWLKQHPEQAQGLLNENPSYVFFVLNDNGEQGPRGSLNVPLTAERSAAVDRSRIPLGTPIWLSTTLPTEAGSDEASKPYQRLLFAQDTGGAINGPVRADVFFGNGELAEHLAGTMKQPGRLFALLPKE